MDACRKYGIKQSELESWTQQFLSSGANALRTHPRDVEEEYEAKIKDLQAKVGELVLEQDIISSSPDSAAMPPTGSSSAGPCAKTRD